MAPSSTSLLHQQRFEQDALLHNALRQQQIAYQEQEQARREVRPGRAPTPGFYGVPGGYGGGGGGEGQLGSREQEQRRGRDYDNLR